MVGCMALACLSPQLMSPKSRGESVRSSSSHAMFPFSLTSAWLTVFPSSPQLSTETYPPRRLFPQTLLANLTSQSLPLQGGWGLARSSRCSLSLLGYGGANALSEMWKELERKKWVHQHSQGKACSHHDLLLCLAIEQATRRNTLRNSYTITTRISRPRPHAPAIRNNANNKGTVEKQVKFVGYGSSAGSAAERGSPLQRPAPAVTRTLRHTSRRSRTTQAGDSLRVRPLQTETQQGGLPALYDENRGRRLSGVADVEEAGESTYSRQQHENSLKSRWSWTSSLDFLWSKSTTRQYRNRMAAQRIMQDDTDGQSSCAEPLGIAV